MIAAGSTGSIPATADLLATIAKLPHGAVVLPGLDTDLDDAVWALIAGDIPTPRMTARPRGHPQFAMQALLTRIGIARDDVEALAPAAWPRTLRLRSACGPPPPPNAGRARPRRQTLHRMPTRRIGESRS